MTVHIGGMRNLMERSTELTVAECAAAEQAATEVVERLMNRKLELQRVRKNEARNI